MRNGEYQRIPGTKFWEILLTASVTSVATVVLTVVGTFLKMAWLDPFPLTVHVQYKNANRNSVAIKGAHVSFEPQVSGQTGTDTDSDGNAVFKELRPRPFSETTIVVQHPNYSDRIPTKVILRGSFGGPTGPTVNLTPNSNQAEISSQSTTPNGNPKPPVNPGGEGARNGDTGSSGPLKPSASPTVVATCASGQLDSGTGGGFSAIYRLCSDAPSCSPKVDAREYKIQSEEFNLVGDRRCGAWATCAKEQESTDARVCHTFQMQGHQEWRGPFGVGGSGIAQSEGVLTVTWVKR